MAHDVLLAEFHAAYARHIAQHAQSRHEAAGRAARQVDLRYVARDYHLGVHAQTREEHLYLVVGGVLRLVEHDDGIVERAAAHEGQGCYLDDVALHVLAQLGGRYHVLQGVVEGLQVGVDLVLHVAGQKAELLAGLDGGTGEDDLAHLAVLEGAHGQRYRHIGLAGAGGTEGEGEVAGEECLDKALLDWRCGR